MTKPRFCFDESNRLRSVRRSHDLVAGVSQRAGSEAPNSFIVVHDENAG
jgi:hypothetical protein